MSGTQTLSATSPLPPQKGIEPNSVEQRLMMQYNIARVLAESNSISKAAAQVLRMICETAGWEFGAFWTVESESHALTNEGVWYVEDANLAEYAEAMRYSNLNADETSLPAFVLHTTQPLWLSNLDNFNSPDAAEAKRAGLSRAFLLPVRSSGRLIAILECLTVREQPLDQNLSDMLNAVGNQIGIFLERKLLEEALEVRANQQHLLAQAGMALAASTNYEQRLVNIMHVVVPDMADWCAIDMIDPYRKELRRVAAAHIDPSKEPLVYAIQPTRTVDIEKEGRPQLQPLLNGQPLLYSDLQFSEIEQAIRDPTLLDMVRQLDPRSSIVVPLLANDRILGICTFVQSDSRRRYLPGDIALAEDIARRIAVGLDNAMLFAQAQKTNLELERRVDERTAQLRNAINQLTNQISERHHAEEQVRILNLELEKRIAERTFQLEVANQNLQKEVAGHQQASQTQRTLLKRTRELYRISQKIGTMRIPHDALHMLLSSSFLKDASRASIAILDSPWPINGAPPEGCTILAEWNRGPNRPHFLNRHFTLKEYGIVLPVPYGKPIVIADILSKKKLPAYVRKRFSDLRTHSLIILPLIATGEWYGLLSLHFSTLKMPNLDDLRHIRGLVDETAIAIKNLRLLEAESQARHEAEVANELKLKFLAMISHELRTPLASIKGFATTLLADDVVWSPERQRDFLQTINIESDKLSDLIEQLLDLSRIEAGILRISPKVYSLLDIITPALPQLHAITTDHPLQLEIPPDLPRIYGDEQRIAQVLTNLVGNAAKYSPPHTPITISTHPSGNSVRIDVADQGIGIPAEERKRIFEAFHQVASESGGHLRGAGLGLAICKGMIEAQGGAIWVQDHPGPGTIISFTIPLASEQETGEGMLQ